MPAAHTSSLTSKEGQTSHLLSSLQVLFKILANMWDKDPGQEQGLSGSVLLLRDGSGQILAKMNQNGWNKRDMLWHSIQVDPNDNLKEHRLEHTSNCNSYIAT